MVKRGKRGRSEVIKSNSMLVMVEIKTLSVTEQAVCAAHQCALIKRDLREYEPFLAYSSAVFAQSI